MLGWAINLGFAGSGAAVSAPVFSGTITDISVDQGTGVHEYDYSSYFSDATSYSLSGNLEPGWFFDTANCILSIDTDVDSTFGPFSITGTNAGGNDTSNNFNVIVHTVYAGGFWYAFEDARIKARKREREEILRLEQQAKKLQEKIDKELNLELQKLILEEIKIEEYQRVAKLAEKHQKLIYNFEERVQKAAQRALDKQTFSSLEALTRELQRAKEEEDFLIQATLMIH